jgi:outer membrane protein FlgP
VDFELKLGALLSIHWGYAIHLSVYLVGTLIKDPTMNRLLITSFSIAMMLLSGCSTLSLHSESEGEAESPAPVHTRSSGHTEHKETLVAPMVQHGEALTATGYAVISVQNSRNPAQQRLLAIRAAKLDAYRSLTEQVYGQHLDATTTVADMTVQNDTFRAKVQGVIYGATLVSITPTGDDTYETTLSLDREVMQDLRRLYLTQVLSRGH